VTYSDLNAKMLLQLISTTPKITLCNRRTTNI